MSNKHYVVSFSWEGNCWEQPFTSFIKAKQYYIKLKLHNNEMKRLRQGPCILIEDSYINCEWVHKEKGFKING